MGTRHATRACGRVSTLPRAKWRELPAPVYFQWELETPTTFMSLTYSVEEKLLTELTEADRAEAAALSAIVYPPEVIAGITFPKSAPPPQIDWQPAQAGRRFAIRHEGQLAAVCRIIPRRIQTTHGALDVLGLAGVMTRPELRLRGFGAKVVRAAFSHVDNGAFTAALFQTRVPEFYETLGCRRVENVFVNSFAENPSGTPWWDLHHMIYPASYQWTEGLVDLLGPAW